MILAVTYALWIDVNSQSYNETNMNWVNARCTGARRVGPGFETDDELRGMAVRRVDKRINLFRLCSTSKCATIITNATAYSCGHY
jgi:hypothetical protein